MGLSLVVDVCVERCKVGLVKVSRHQEHWILGRVAWEWLVKWIISDDIRIVGKFG